MSDAIIGTGILIKMGDGATPEVFTAVAQLSSVDPPDLSRNKIDASIHNEGVESKILGMLRQGDPAFKTNWLPNEATHIQIRADIRANTKRNWQIAFPPAGYPQWTFPARVASVKIPSVTLDTKMEGDISLAIDGTITEVLST